jgi:hypothetical protein
VKRSASPAGWLGPLDAAGQQVVWWTAVLHAARGGQAWAATGPLLLVALHLVLQPAGRSRIAAAGAMAALYGLATDTVLCRSGLLAFAASPGATTAWMVALWSVFGVALTASLRSVAGWSVPVQALAAAVAGPLAYRAGAALGAISLPGGSAPALAAVALQWALGLPALAAVARGELWPGEPAGEPPTSARLGSPR